MTRFLVRRLAWTVVVLFVVVTLLFLVMRSIGGNPFRHGPLLGLSHEAWVKYGDPQPQSIRDNQRRKYGLDRSWYRQYADYLESLARFDFGPSLSFRNRDVNTILREQGPVSLELVALAIGWAIVLGVPLGLLAGLRPGRIEDVVATTVALAGYALPAFLLGTVAIWLFSVELGWVATTGGRLLPSLTLGMLPTAYVARLVRAGVVEAMEQEFVQAARARGLRKRRVVLVHALRPALIPVLSAAGPLLGALVTGLFVVEDVFQVPGVGRYYVAAAGARDNPLVLGLTIVAAALVIVANAVADVLHGVLDPRIRERT